MHSLYKTWCNLLEGIAPESEDANTSYWHSDPEDFDANQSLNEAVEGSTYYRNNVPEEDRYTQVIKVFFRSNKEFNTDNQKLINAGLEPLQVGDQNWVKSDKLPMYCKILGFKNVRIKPDRNTIIRVMDIKPLKKTFLNGGSKKVQQTP